MIKKLKQICNGVFQASVNPIPLGYTYCISIDENKKTVRVHTIKIHDTELRKIKYMFSSYTVSVG